MTEPANVREQLRAAQERVAQIREENAALERRLFKPTGLRNWTVAGILAAALAGTLGFVISNRAGHARAKAESDAWDRANEVQRRRLATETCKASLDQTLADLLSCQRSLVPPAPQAPRLGTPCTCQASDPLCSCL